MGLFNFCDFCIGDLYAYTIFNIVYFFHLKISEVKYVKFDML